MSNGSYPQSLIVMRERNSFQTMDLGLIVLRQWWKPLLWPMILGALPFYVLNQWVLSSMEISPLAQPFVWLALLIMETPWAAIAVEITLGSLVFGQRISPRTLFLRFQDGFTKFFYYQFLLRLGYLSLFITAFIIPSRFGFLNEVIFLERHPWKGLTLRHEHLAFRSELGLLAFRLILFGVSFVIPAWMGLNVLRNLLVKSSVWFDPYDFLLNDWLFQLLVWVALQIFVVIRFLHYLDSRTRGEGWDYQNRIKIWALNRERGK